MLNKKNIKALFFVLSIIVFSCNSPYVPKPRGYFRIDFPERKYQVFDEPGYPYTFEYPVYAKIVKDSTFFDENPDNPYWINIDYPQFNGRMYLSYKTIGGSSVYKIKTATGYKDSIVRNTFDGLKDEAYRMTYKHTLKATSIEDSLFVTTNHVAGVYFNVGGNAATAKQFYVSDTGKHFLRGALYFDSAPNSDSLDVVNGFLQEDMKHMINTLRWR
jgi:gliding motility-associated lipoprotein GldD